MTKERHLIAMGVSWPKVTTNTSALHAICAAAMLKCLTLLKAFSADTRS